MYRLRFYTSLAEGFSHPEHPNYPNIYLRNSTITLEQIASALTDTNLLVVAPIPAPWYYYNHYYNVTPTVEHSGSFLSDTVNWMEISGLFTATGNEKYLTLGLFHHPWQVNYQVRWLDSTNVQYYAYYYFDDISICPTDTVLPPCHAGPDTLLCYGDSVQLGESPTNEWFYRWRPVAGLSDTLAANPIARPLITTTYILEGTDPCFTKTWDTVTVYVKKCGPNAGMDTIVCKESSLVLGDSSNIGYSCQWSPSTYLSSDTVPMPICTPHSDITYYLTVSDTSGVLKTDSIRVSLFNYLAADAGHDTLLCYGDSLWLGNISQQSGWTFHWKPGAGLSDSSAAQPGCRPLKATSYVLETTDPCGKLSRDTVHISVDKCGPNAGMDTTICLKAAILLGDSLNQGYHCQWSPSYYLSSDTVARPLCQPTAIGTWVYYLSLSDSTGLVKTDSVLVEVVDCSGIEENDRPGFLVIPNPVKGNFSLIFASPFTGHLNLLDISGRILQSAVLKDVNLYQMNTGHLPPGMYILQLRSQDGKLASQRVVVR